MSTRDELRARAAAAEQAEARVRALRHERDRLLAFVEKVAEIQSTSEAECAWAGRTARQIMARKDG